VGINTAYFVRGSVWAGLAGWFRATVEVSFLAAMFGAMVI